jgi:hypothetical protein
MPSLSVDEGFCVLVCGVILAFIGTQAVVPVVGALAGLVLIALLGAIIGFCWAVGLSAKRPSG